MHIFRIMNSVPLHKDLTIFYFIVNILLEAKLQDAVSSVTNALCLYAILLIAFDFPTAINTFSVLFMKYENNFVI